MLNRLARRWAPAALLLTLLPGAALAQGGPNDAALLPAALEASARGCDLLDAESCLYPFPSDHYTAVIEDAQAARSQNIYTGRRVNFSALATPRNAAGKPIDPTEWNRNDGFSPGTMIFSYIEGLDRAGLLVSFGFTPVGDPDQDNRVGITNPGITLAPNAPIQVINARTGERHPVWAEMDVNQNYMLPEANELGGNGVDRPAPGRSALILRPARNFTPGERYVVVIQNLRAADGNAISAGPAFEVCRDDLGSEIPQVNARCAALEADVFPVIENAQLNRGDVVLAWDFTVASAQNLTARLTHMHDDAFAALAEPEGSLPVGNGSADCTRYDYAAEPANLTALNSDYVNGCRSPDFTVDKVSEKSEGEVIQIEGTLKLPSYVIPTDPSPADSAEAQALFDQMAEIPGISEVAGAEFFFVGRTGNLLPTNRLNYLPTDNTAPPADADAVNLLPYGDGLPDRTAGVGEITVRYLCQVKKSIRDGQEAPARATLYGHGLLQSRFAVDYDEGKRMVKRNNFLMCGLDWYGFSQADLHNVIISLFDMSHWPAIPDASQQGMLNFMFLARAMQHPGGLASHPAFQIQQDGVATGVPFFDRSEIFYYGNSQGGILPGPVLAVSKDVNRGVFGVPGMNYSTLLRRSTDFTLYSIPVYLSYQDELDRNVVFAMIQMLWDRGENNAYAPYLTHDGQAIYGGLEGNANLDGQDNHVLLHPAFSDHQVTYWTADVMARTMGAVSDRQMLLDNPFCDADPAKCDPDVDPNFLLPVPSYDAEGRAPAGPAEVVWMRPEVKAPPIVELPPSSDEHGPDPHGYPRNHATSLCQMSQFLRTDGFLADVTPLWLRADASDRKNDNEAVLAECADRWGVPITVAKAAIGAPDADADGVADAFDQCAATPSGEVANAEGCSVSQRDADADGVEDDNDNCPTFSNADQADADQDGIGDVCELTVSLSADPTSGDVTDGALTVNFTATPANIAEDAGDLSYVFYWGNGQNSGVQTSNTASYPYAQAGSYTARVVVIDERNNGASDTVAITTTTTVTVNPGPIVVDAELSITKTSETAPSTVTFDASGSTAPAGAIYRFDFGNGDVQQGPESSAVRSYALAGNYSVTLTVTDADDSENTDSITSAYTIGSGQQATAQLTVNPSTANIDQLVTFDASASLPSEGASIVSYTFDFGDGSDPVTRSVAEFPSDAGIATYAYSSSGSFTPSVTVTDDAQQQVTVQAKVSVRPVGGSNPDAPAASGGGGALGAALLMPLILLGLRRRRG